MVAFTVALIGFVMVTFAGVEPGFATEIAKLLNKGKLGVSASQKSLPVFVCPYKPAKPGSIKIARTITFIQRNGK